MDNSVVSHLLVPLLWIVLPTVIDWSIPLIQEQYTATTHGVRKWRSVLQPFNSAGTAKSTSLPDVSELTFSQGSQGSRLHAASAIHVLRRSAIEIMLTGQVWLATLASAVISMAIPCQPVSSVDVENAFSDGTSFFPMERALLPSREYTLANAWPHLPIEESFYNTAKVSLVNRVAQPSIRARRGACICIRGLFSGFQLLRLGSCDVDTRILREIGPSILPGRDRELAPVWGYEISGTGGAVSYSWTHAGVIPCQMMTVWWSPEGQDDYRYPGTGCHQAFCCPSGQDFYELANTTPLQFLVGSINTRHQAVDTPLNPFKPLAGSINTRHKCRDDTSPCGEDGKGYIPLWTAVGTTPEIASHGGDTESPALIGSWKMLSYRSEARRSLTTYQLQLP